MSNARTSSKIWQHCLTILETQVDAQAIAMWFRPVQAIEQKNSLDLYVPNRAVENNLQPKLATIQKILGELGHTAMTARIVVGNPHPKTNANTANQRQTSLNLLPPTSAPNESKPEPQAIPSPPPQNAPESPREPPSWTQSTPPIARLSFAHFVIGKSNQTAHAAALNVAENPGKQCNPLLIYGGVGLGKTHLMHAAGNAILQRTPDSKVLFVHAERFVNEMVSTLRHGRNEDFKNYYRSIDVLLIDDIQFFAGKEHSQEEFFHTFNTLVDSGRQIIMTSDRYPRELSALDDRLKSRFGWGLSVCVEPPDLETRVAILLNKAEQHQLILDNDIAFFIARGIQHNVRELEGALQRLVNAASFHRVPITLSLAQRELRDMVAHSMRHSTEFADIEAIQRAVAQFFNLRLMDMMSNSRQRNLARPRQFAMALAKEFTEMSLPEIGLKFGGRDHTTVLHACRKVEALIDADEKLNNEYQTLRRLCFDIANTTLI